VRRLSAIEALGRVDITCADKTGTMTKGRLVLSLVASGDSEAKIPGNLPADVCHVLLTAALASPHPDAPDARAHPTGVAIVQGALEAGLGDQVRVQHEAELSCDPGILPNVACVCSWWPKALLIRLSTIHRD
jgi:cation-transporting P-type ATPase I